MTPTARWGEYELARETAAWLQAACKERGIPYAHLTRHQMIAALLSYKPEL